jgi:hypothetical protein
MVVWINPVVRISFAEPSVKENLGSRGKLKHAGNICPPTGPRVSTSRRSRSDLREWVLRPPHQDQTHRPTMTEHVALIHILALMG